MLVHARPRSNLASSHKLFGIASGCVVYFGLEGGEILPSDNICEHAVLPQSPTNSFALWFYSQQVNMDRYYNHAKSTACMYIQSSGKFGKVSKKLHRSLRAACALRL